MSEVGGGGSHLQPCPPSPGCQGTRFHPNSSRTQKLPQLWEPPRCPSHCRPPPSSCPSCQRPVLSPQPWPWVPRQVSPPLPHLSQAGLGPATKQATQPFLPRPVPAGTRGGLRQATPVL